MPEANELPNEGTSSATCLKDKDPLSNDQTSESFKGWMGIMTVEEIKVLNTDDNKAFCMAVSSGDVEKARSMLNKDPGLAMMKIQNGMFPIHMAASCGHLQMLRFLFRWTGLYDLDWEQKVHLFFTSLKNNIFDVAYLMLKRCPTLAGSRDEELTALHVIARKPLEEFSRKQVTEDGSKFDQVQHLPLIKELWALTKGKDHNDMLEFISKPSWVLFDATKSGNLSILKLLLQSNPEFFMILDSKRRSLFHNAVLYRQERVLIHLINHGILKDIVMQAVDEDRNNILHIAGMLPPHGRFGSSRPDIQMQRELLWFKEVEKRVPTALRTMENKDGETPKEIFDKEHEGLTDKGKTAAKDTANYGMLVATIVATIVFAASLAVPGHDVSPDSNSSILQEKRSYVTFILSDSIALFSSSLSIIFFLSVLTSRFRENEFISSLQLKLMFGVTTLFVAVTTMVVAFTAAIFLIFNRRSTWVSYLVAALGFITVAVFVLLLYTLFGDLISSLYWSRHLFHPTNYHQRLKSDRRILVTIASLLIGLTATFLLIFRHRSTWLFYLDISLGVLAGAFLVWPLFSFSDYLIRLFWSRCIKSDTILYYQMILMNFVFTIRYKLVCVWDLMCQKLKVSKHHQEDIPV